MLNHKACDDPNPEGLLVVPSCGNEAHNQSLYNLSTLTQWRDSASLYIITRCGDGTSQAISFSLKGTNLVCFKTVSRWLFCDIVGSDWISFRTSLVYSGAY